jgi:hypothetical protein
LSVSAVLSIINYNIYKVSYYKSNFFHYLVSTNPTDFKDLFSNTKSVCYNALIRPLKLHKYVLSPFLRQVSVPVLLPASSVLNAPRFNLLLDICEYETESGIIRLGRPVKTEGEE